MKDLKYTIIEKRISRLERLIANEQLNQKNEFLGLGRKKPTEDSVQFVLDILNEDDTYDRWERLKLTNGWQDQSVTGKIFLALYVNNHKIPRSKKQVEYKVLLWGTDLKKLRLEITRDVKYGDEETIINKFVPAVKPDQIRKVSSLIIDSISPADFLTI